MSQSKTLIIAEAGVNHNGNLNLAQQLIDIAKKAEADIIKFQTFKAQTLVSKQAKKANYQIQNDDLDSSDSQYVMLKKLELSENQHYQLVDYCKQKRIQFLSTAFDLDSLDFLHSLNLPFFKIPSGEITNLPYLKKVASLGKPIILSTGMATLSEVGQALNVLTNYGLNLADITVLHCNTEYPTPFIDVNLRAMLTIQQEFGVKVGYSDHTLGIEVAIAAVALGACVIEKHFTLSRDLAGPDHKASLEPDELTAMIKAIRNIEVAMGNGVKQPSTSEQKNIPIARKSIHLKRDLKKGDIIREEDLIMKRPGDGIAPMLIEDVIGKTVRYDLPTEHKLQFSDVL
jgi:N-acetylneuraminate synthase